ncbi:hypothetical protein GCM10010116_15520 [Microbispora rosea subsp. aerata]|nr:DUF6703 family protein [Microbispora rosea]GGO07705.1 hypothetical protein GCM10010116_15520 [Microbispora rosea subsp. aerata]GIH53251.1 hypothetical protein Mro02_01650 [Microbispora rosea subsp. aerata]GLJ83837.1 hypothetical protein GCM10017588_25650 [Microbispora rosea subsp. aerata]
MGSETEPPRRQVPAHPLAKKSPARGNAAPPRVRRPLPPGEQFFTPGATGLRAEVERRSAAPLVFLFQQPRWLTPLVMVALLITALVVPDWRGGVAVLPVLAFITWLAYLSWPSLRPVGRLLRVAVGTFLILLAATRFGLI